VGSESTHGAPEASDGDQAADAVGALAARLGHAFADPALLVSALTHRSASQEVGDAPSYERLEFLGDAVLGMVAAEWLYNHVEAAEGELSRRKGYLVSEPVLAALARRLGLGALLRLGVGEERSGGREKPSLLADALEAVIGALYLDGGLAAARRVVEPLLAGAVAGDRGGAPIDAKTVLQERLQAMGHEPPEYRLVDAVGPDHQKRFTVECWAAGRRLGRGEGSSKKRAEQAAAAAALETLS
jgi:ribonuclease-3